MTEAFLGLGGNLGDRAATLRAAIAEMGEAPGMTVLGASSIYETPPWGPVPQGLYLNACIAVETTLSPRALLALCLATELRHGRERLVRWGPRTLDIDILLYGGETIDEPGLVIPHPRMRQRAFVLAPLAEIAPAVVLHGRTATEWLRALDESERAAVVRFSEAG